MLNGNRQVQLPLLVMREGACRIVSQVRHREGRSFPYLSGCTCATMASASIPSMLFVIQDVYPLSKRQESMVGEAFTLRYIRGPRRP
jgi:regulator of RNase E activity RraA